MKTYIYLLIPCICFICSSCTQKEQYKHCSTFSNERLAQLPSHTLSGKKLVFDQDVQNPVKLALIDSVLFLTNMNTSILLDKYDIKNLQKAGDCIPFGSGPNEMLIVNSIQRTDSTAWLFDQSQNKLYQFMLSDLITQQEPSPINTIKLDMPVDNVLVLSPNSIVATTLNPENKRLSFFDKTGKCVRNVSAYPDFGEEMSEYERIESFACQAILSIDKQHIILTYKRTDLIEIYDLNGNLKSRTQGPDLFFPSLKQRTDGEHIRVVSDTGKNFDAYFNPCIYKDEIFVLYSGLEFDGEKANYLLDRIIVFNLSGNPIRQYKLSEPIFNFTIDPESKKIYGISDDPEFHIVEFCY